MRIFGMIILSVIAVVLASSLSPAQEDGVDGIPELLRNDWHETVKELGFTEGDVRKLEQNKILVSNQAFRQIFDPYYNSKIPLFITSDSLLNAYHVLFEETVCWIETANAERLPAILTSLLEKLAILNIEYKKEPGLAVKARRHANIVLGTALRLLGIERVRFDPDIEKIISMEVGRVVEARKLVLPEWLGPSESGFLYLDYSRFKPRGFYTRSNALTRYFRAVSWLQAIPFRPHREKELLAILLISTSLQAIELPPSGRHEDGPAAFFRFYETFIGSVDNWDLDTVSRLCPPIHEKPLRLVIGKNEASAIQHQILEQAKKCTGPFINDQIALPPKRRYHPSFRVQSAYRTPDAVIFQNTTDPIRFPGRTTPSGLEVCIALDSSFAGSLLQEEQKKRVLAEIEKCKPLLAGPSLYCEYLRCLQTLLEKPEDGAPAFMKTTAWKTKSCQTVLAGGAQLRHTWALQSKDTVRYSGIGRRPTGFVEPVPEFYRRLADLVRRTEEMVRGLGPLRITRLDRAREIRSAVEILRECDFVKRGYEVIRSLTRDQRIVVVRILRRYASGRQKGEALLGWLEGLASALEKGKIPSQYREWESLEDENIDYKPRWRVLGKLCKSLEQIAGKHLAGSPLDPEDDKTIFDYGSSLKMIMGYHESAPSRDDAPRIVDVFTATHRLPELEYLEVGVGRAVAVYVLFPANGQEVLCRGAVMPYYEFCHSDRLTNDQWMKLLDSEEPPAQPAWIHPILQDSSLARTPDD